MGLIVLNWNFLPKIGSYFSQQCSKGYLEGLKELQLRSKLVVQISINVSSIPKRILEKSFDGKEYQSTSEVELDSKGVLIGF